MPYHRVQEKFALVCLALWLGLTQTANTSTHDIKVRLIDVHNGRVYANETIRVHFHIPLTPEFQTLESKTGADGTAIFHLPDPAPANISVDVESERLSMLQALLH